MRLIFDIRTDKKRTPIVQQRIKDGQSGFRTKWGLYGTDEWFENLKNEGLIETLNGTITNLLMTGHNDFPEFEFKFGEDRFQFEMLGNEDDYVVGKKIKVEAIKGMYVNPMSGFENHLEPLRIEIE